MPTFRQVCAGAGIAYTEDSTHLPLVYRRLQRKYGSLHVRIAIVRENALPAIRRPQCCEAALVNAPRGVHHVIDAMHASWILIGTVHAVMHQEEARHGSCSKFHHVLPDARSHVVRMEKHAKPACAPSGHQYFGGLGEPILRSAKVIEECVQDALAAVVNCHPVDHDRFGCVAGK